MGSIRAQSMIRPFFTRMVYDCKMFSISQSSDPLTHITPALQSPRQILATSQHSRGKFIREWSPEMHDLLEECRKQASGYAQLYEALFASAKQWAQRLVIFKGILASLVGTVGALSLMTDMTYSPLWMRITQAVIAYFLGIISVIEMAWDLSGVEVESIIAQSAFCGLVRDIEWTLALPPGDRPHASQYVRSKLAELARIRTSSPPSPKRLKKQFESRITPCPPECIRSPSIGSCASLHRSESERDD